MNRNINFKQITEQKFEKIIKFKNEMLELEKKKDNEIAIVIDALSKSYKIVKNKYLTSQKTRNQLFRTASILDGIFTKDCENFRLDILTKEELVDLKKIRKTKEKLINDNGCNIAQIVTDLDQIDQLKIDTKKKILINTSYLKTQNDEIQGLQTNINALKPEEIQLDRAFAEAESSIESLAKSKNDEIDILEEELDAIENQLSELSNRIEKLKRTETVKQPENDKIFPLKKIIVE